MKISSLIIILLLVVKTSSVFSGEHTKNLEQGQTSPKASIQQVSWIAGRWTGEAFGGTTEEIWSPPADKSMMAVFRMSKNGDVNFYEIEIIREINNSLVLELKHFSNELKGWETKNQVVSFPLVEINEKAVYFDGMTFLKISNKEMHVYVDVETDGKTSEIQFIYQRNHL